MNTLSKSLMIALTVLGISTATIAAPVATSDEKGHQGHAALHKADGAKSGGRMARHLAALHDKLKLSTEQEPAWTAFVAAATPSAPAARPDRAAFAKLTAPERLEKWITLSQERIAKQQNILTTLKTFHAGLTPEQKKIFDDNVPGGMHAGKRGMGGMGGMRGMHQEMHSEMHDEMHTGKHVRAKH
jgi:protein CpxP